MTRRRLSDIAEFRRGIHERLSRGEIMMKTTLFISTLAAGLLVVSTTTFAQNFVNYPQAYSSVTPGAAPSWGYTAPADRFTRSGLGHQGKVTMPTHTTTRSRAPAGAVPAQQQ
jgi:hypothetical protein